MSASSNRAKSDLDPGQWKPIRDAAWCEYARGWVTVKKAWDLSADQNEVEDLEVMLRTCTGSPTPATTAPTPTTATTTSPPVSGETVTVTALDCQGEAVTVRNGGTSPAELTSWSIYDDGPNFTFGFPAGYTLAPGAAVTIRSGGSAGRVSSAGRRGTCGTTTGTRHIWSTPEERKLPLGAARRRSHRILGTSHFSPEDQEERCPALASVMPLASTPEPAPPAP